jgi:AcrR family transcriptional regulator
MGKNLSQPKAPAPLWRKPTQERSRQRVEEILQAAVALIAEGGSDNLKMREVAQRAGVPIGSLYQFFPDRNALLACLFARHLEGVHDLVRERYAGVTSLDAFIRASDGLIEDMQRLLAEPAFVDIWIAVQGSKELRHLDLAESRRDAEVIYRALRPLVGPEVSDERLETACFLICDLCGRSSYVALGMPREEGDRLVREYAEVTRAYTLSILGYTS